MRLNGASIDAFPLVYVELHSHDRQLQHIVLPEHHQRGIGLGNGQPAGKHTKEDDHNSIEIPRAAPSACVAILQPRPAACSPEDDGCGRGEE